MKVKLPISILISLFTLLACNDPSGQKEYSYIDLSKFEDGIHHWVLFSRIRSTIRLDTCDITGIADNLLAYQNANGGWPKNIDWLAVLDPDSVINELSEHYRSSTFDNRNIFPQIEYLSAVYLRTREEKYRLAAERGFKYILDQEYSKGGWRGWDANVITFNDDVMTGIMNLLLDVKEEHEYYGWLESGMREKILEAYERGLQVILKCQIRLMGKKTAWCQQHDFDTYAPVQGRSYEHPSITARESCDIVLFLMRIQEPDPSVADAVESAVKWLEEVKITGYRYGKIPIEERPYHESTVDFDRVFVPDTTAPPVWARYYDLKNSKPFLSRHDGTLVYELSELSFERRIGYEWYGYWPEWVLDSYAGWKNH